MTCRKTSQAERNYRKHSTKDARIKLKIVSKTTAQVIAHTRDTNFPDKLGNACGNPRQVFGIVDYLLGNDKRQDYPDADSNKSLAESFAQFFENKVQSIHMQLSVIMDDKCDDHNKFAIGITVTMLNCIRHVS